MSLFDDYHRRQVFPVVCDICSETVELPVWKIRDYEKSYKYGYKCSSCVEDAKRAGLAKTLRQKSVDFFLANCFVIDTEQYRIEE
jgi:hypothetical protein